MYLNKEMTQEDKIKIVKLIRQETGCGLLAAKSGFAELLFALKNPPLTVMDNPPRLKITWERDDNN